MAADTSWLPGSLHAVLPASNSSGLSLDMGQLQGQVCALKSCRAVWDTLELQADRHLTTSDIVMRGRGKNELKSIMNGELKFIC